MENKDVVEYLRSRGTKIVNTVEEAAKVGAEMKKTKDKDELYRGDFKDRQDRINHILNCLFSRRGEILKHSLFPSTTFFWLGKTFQLDAKRFTVI
jgi:hypothetical protein